MVLYLGVCIVFFGQTYCLKYPHFVESSFQITITTSKRERERTISIIFVNCNFRIIDRKEGRNWVLHRFQQYSYVISQPDRSPKPGRNSLLFRYSSKGSFNCKKTIDSPPQRRTFMYLLRDPEEIRTCELTLGARHNVTNDDCKAGASMAEWSVVLYTDCSAL